MKVAVGLSGGVDSSVAALLLKQAGDDVSGVLMRLHPCSGSPSEQAGICRGASQDEDIRAAEDVCARLSIPFRVIDCSRSFEDLVLRRVRETYLAGTTPNPCVLCNPLIKFGVLPAAARAAGLAFDRFATGHYAGLRRDAATGRFLLERAADRAKDQSYFLYRLDQAQLATALFPLGGLAKGRVRELARAAGLPVHDRKESQDFHDGSLAELLGRPPREGDIVDRAGRVLGRHRGAWSYTVGQRHGLGVAHPVPLYVLATDVEENRVVVGPRRETFAAGCLVRDCVWGPFETLAAPAEARVKVRSAGRPAAATVSPLGADRARVVFAEPVSSVAPGQSAVFYDGDTVLGGGVIEAAA